MECVLHALQFNLFHLNFSNFFFFLLIKRNNYVRTKFYYKISCSQGQLDAFWDLRPTYLILVVKLLLINMNYVEFFLFFRNFIDRKILTKFFILIDVVSKRVALVVDLDEN